MNLREWMKVKWSFLSRLPNESNEPHLPFLDQVEELHINHVDSMSQEVKALQENEAGQPSDTFDIARLENWEDKTKLNGE